MAKNPQITQTDAEAKRHHREEQARRAKRRTRQLLGLALSILIVVGALSIINQGVKTVRSMLDTSGLADEYLTRITPLVWFDILPFESLDKADQNILKEAAIWGVLNAEGSSIQRSDLGEPLIPAAAIDSYAADLYGPAFSFVHETFTDTFQDLTYVYDEATQVYTAQSAGLTPQYLPTVVDVVRENGGHRVIVGYVSTTSSTNELLTTPDYDHPARFMDYFFRRDGSEYYLESIQPNLTYTAEAQAEQSASSGAAASELLPGEEDGLSGGSVSGAPGTGASSSDSSSASGGSSDNSESSGSESEEAA